MSNKDACRIRYYKVLDAILSEFDKCFNSTNILLMNSIGSLTPRSSCFMDFDNLKPFIDHYGLNADDIAGEMSTARRLACLNEQVLKIKPLLVFLRH